jgi:hypothetical protein
MSGANASPMSITSRGSGVGSQANVRCRVYSTCGPAVDGPARGQREYVGGDGGRVPGDALAVAAASA